MSKSASRSKNRGPKGPAHHGGGPEGWRQVPIVVNLPEHEVGPFRAGFLAGQRGVALADCPYTSVRQRELWREAHYLGRDGRSVRIVPYKGWLC